MANSNFKSASNLNIDYSAESSSTPASNDNVQKDQSIKKGSAGKYIAIIIVLALVVTGVYYIYTNPNILNSGKSSISSKYLSLENNQSFGTFANILKAGYSNTTILNASYYGTISVAYSVLNINFPFTLIRQKYKNDSVEKISINISSLSNSLNLGSSASSASQNLNLSIYYINGTVYSCSKGTQYTTSSCENTTTAIKNGQVSTTYASLENFSNLSKLLSKVLTIQSNNTVSTASYSGNSCTMFSEDSNIGINLTPLESYTSSSAAGLPKINNFNAYIDSCLSNTYYGVPYNLSINVPDITIIANQSSGSSTGPSKQTISLSLVLNSKYVNNVLSQSEVDTLPYPIINMSSSLGTTGVNNSIGYNLHNTVNVSCIAQNGFTCSNANYNNSQFSLNFNLSQTTFSNGLNDPSAIYLNTTQAENFSKTNTLPAFYISMRAVNNTFVNNSNSANLHYMGYKIQYPVGIDVFNFSNPITGEILVAYNITGYGYCNLYVRNTTGCTFIKAAIISK